MRTCTELFNHLLEPPYRHLAVAAVLLLALLYLIHRYQRSRRGIVPFRSQGGDVEISPRTLRWVLQNTVAGVTGIERASCRHFVRGRRLGVRVAIHLRANQSLREVEARIKRRIRATLMEQFGIETVEPIHIRVTRLIGDLVPSRAGETGADHPREEAVPHAELPESRDDRTDSRGDPF